MRILTIFQKICAEKMFHCYDTGRIFFFRHDKKLQKLFLTKNIANREKTCKLDKMRNIIHHLLRCFDCYGQRMNGKDFRTPVRKGNRNIMWFTNMQRNRVFHAAMLLYPLLEHTKESQNAMVICLIRNHIHPYK